MPVAGLPAAEEASFSSLLVSQELSSWKVVGEAGANTVVVLRFSQCDGQPLLAGRNIRGTFRRKPPCQVNRDLRRAELHRANRKQNTTSSNSSVKADANCILQQEDVGSAAPINKAAAAVVTSDLPLGQIGLSTNDTVDRPCFVPDHQHMATIDAAPAPTAQNEITAEFCEEIFSRVTKKLTGRMAEISEDLTAVRENLADIADIAAPRATSHQVPPPPTPSNQASSKPLTTPDPRRLDDKQGPSSKDEATFPVSDRSLPTTTHREKADDSVCPPRGRSVEARMKLRSARFPRSDCPD